MLTNEQVIRSLSKLSRAAREIDVRVVLLINVVEDRRMHLEAGCPSLHHFCRRHFRWSEGTTHRRVEAARVARRCPSIVGYIRSGAITLSALALAGAQINESNVAEWVPRLAGKTRREIEALLADMSPKPAVPSLVRQLPPLRTESSRLPYTAARAGVVHPQGASGAPAATGEMAVPPPPRSRPVRLQPLGASRWKIQLTAGQSLHDKLGRAIGLMRHKNPTGDLAVVLEAALDALIERLEKPRRLRVPAKVRAARPIQPGEVSAATRREVFERDEHRCTFVSADGERCPATEGLEIDHIIAKALGGSGEAPNLRLRCHGHNKLHAEKVFGRDHIERRIQERKAAQRAASAKKQSQAEAVGERKEVRSAESAERDRRGERRAGRRESGERDPARTGRRAEQKRDGAGA